MKLFVYGSLMQGQRNHEHLKDSAFLGEAETGSEFEMLTNGSIPICRRGSEVVHGELYEASEAVIKDIEVLEEVAAGLYEHIETTIKGEKAAMFLGGNILNSDTWEKVPGGDWKAYKKAHGM